MKTRSFKILAMALGLAAGFARPSAAFPSSSSDSPPPKNDPPTQQQQGGNATTPTFNPSLTLSDSVGTMMGNLGDFFSHGLQWKSPVLSPTVSYRSLDDSSNGGFGGNEYVGDLAFDVDIYDGLIAGLVYQRAYRGATNAFGTSERLDSNGASFFLAKRFFEFLNVGLAYQYTTSEHRLTRAVNMNLDREGNGGSVFVGVSKRKGLWSGALTGSFGYVHDDYDQQTDLDTGRFSLSGTVSCDIVKEFAVGVGFSYNRFVVQDTLPGTSARDDDYWTIGPRLRFFPTNDITVRLDFDTMEGYADYKALTVRLGLDFAF